MLTKEACPASSQLECMLDGTLPPDDQTQVSLHLERCADCQTRFEELAHAVVSLPDAKSQAVARQESALMQVMERLVDEGPDAALPDEEPHLPFLTPSDSPEYLGRLGPYNVVGLIGQGGMGIVLKAHDSRLNRFVAIKVLAPQLAAYAGARKRFLREAQAVAALNHDHIVTIHAVEEFNGFPYIVMEYVIGVSLAEQLRGGKPLELNDTLRIGSQIAAGLAVAHAHGLIHRDIKPANILLEQSGGKVKITDFGLARAVGETQITQSGHITGTPEFMSPEQARGQWLDQRSDLFSLGCVLYAMHTGLSPFRSQAAWDSIARVCNEQPRPLRELNPHTPDWLADIIVRLLAKTPDDRFQRAADVAELLERHLAEQRESPVSRSGVVSPGARRWKPRTAAAVALLLAIVGFAVYEIVIRIHRDGGDTVVRVEPGSDVAIHGNQVDVTPPKSAEKTPRGTAPELAQQGWAHWQKGEMGEAAAKFEQAVTLAPKNENALNGLGWANFHLGKSAEAKDAFERAIAIRPNHPAALNGLGQLCLMQRKFDQAETYLLKASPKASAAWHGLARLYLIQGKFDKAEKWAKKIVDSGQADDGAKQMLHAAKDKRLSDELRQMIEPPPAESDAGDEPKAQK